MLRLTLSAAVVLLLVSWASAGLYDTSRSNFSCANCSITATAVGTSGQVVNFHLSGNGCKTLKAFFIRRPCCDDFEPIRLKFDIFSEDVDNFENYNDEEEDRRRNGPGEGSSNSNNGEGKNRRKCDNPIGAELGNVNTCDPQLKIKFHGRRGCNCPRGFDIIRFDVRPNTAMCDFTVDFSEEVDLPSSDLRYILRTQNKCFTCGENDIECEPNEPVKQCPSPFAPCTKDSAENKCNCTRTVVRACTSVLIDGQVSNWTPGTLWNQPRSDTEIECCKQEDKVTGTCKLVNGYPKCVINEDDLPECPVEPKSMPPM
jgi:hypothetical protein